MARCFLRSRALGRTTLPSCALRTSRMARRMVTLSTAPPWAVSLSRRGEGLARHLTLPIGARARCTVARRGLLRRSCPSTRGRLFAGRRRGRESGPKLVLLRSLAGRPPTRSRSCVAMARGDLGVDRSRVFVGVSCYQQRFVAARDWVHTYRMEPLKLYAPVWTQQRLCWLTPHRGQGVRRLTASPGHVRAPRLRTRWFICATRSFVCYLSRPPTA